MNMMQHPLATAIALFVLLSAKLAYAQAPASPPPRRRHR